MFHSPLIRIALLLAIVLIMNGCGGSGNRPASFSSWQGQMQAYVSNVGNGDMNALRDIDVTPGQPGFRAFSNDRPEKSKDIVGVLVGVNIADGRPWYVYLVGEVNREQVITMRLAAISQSNGRFVWRIGSDEANAAAMYRSHREQEWNAQHPNASNPPRRALNFPNPDDQLTMTSAGERITVRESASGAQWTLNLTEQQPQSRTSS